MRITALLLALSLSLPLLAQPPSPAVVRASEDFSNVARKVGPAVVNISSSRVVHRRGNPFWNQFFYGGSGSRAYRRSSLGSGIILDKNGRILTNAHVVANADAITIKLQNGDEYEATVLGEDSEVDLAVLKINPKKGKRLPIAPLGDSDKVRVGGWAIAIGNPFGLDHTVTVGVISAKGRSNVFSGQGAGRYQNFIQTDASINPGNSGGALCDIHGNVIGINTAIYGSEGNIGIGFAIPINMVKRAVPDLVERGRVIPPRLGFYTQDLSPSLVKALGLENADGVLLTDVAAEGPADKAGLQRGDVITIVNGEAVKNSIQLKSRLYEIAPGQEIVITVIRDGKKRGLRIIGEDPEEGREGTWHGLRVRENSRDHAIKEGLYTSHGLVVTDVRQGSSADQIGLKPLDVIIEINRVRLKTMKDWKNITRKVSDREDAVLLIIRGKSHAYIVLPAEAEQ